MSISIKALILEDRQTDADLMLHELKRAGFEVEWVCVEARGDYLDHLSSEWDIILADYSLPQYNALRALQDMQARGLDIPFIIVTGSVSEEVAVECMKQGATDYLLKDRLTRLGPAISRAIEEKLLHLERMHAEKLIQENELRYRTIFETAAVSIWEEDFTEVKQAFDDLKQQGVTDFPTYLNEHPEFVAQAAQMIKVRDVNEATLKMLGAQNKEELLGSLDKVFVPETLQIFREELIVIAEGQTYFEGESINQTLQGERINVLLTMKIPQETARFDSVLVSIIDITERKRLEQQSQRLLKQQIAANQLALSLGESLELADVYQIIYKHVVELMDVDAFVISSYEQAAQLIHAGFVIMEGNLLDATKLPPIPLEKDGLGTQSQVIRTGDPIYIPDFRVAMVNTETEHVITEDGEVLEGSPPDDQRDVSTNSAILVPMKDKGVTIGVLQVQSHSLDAYSLEDVDLLSGLANVASIAIQNARLFSEAHQRMERLKSLHRIDQAISGTVSLAVALDVVLEQAVNQLEVDAAAVLLYQKELHTLEFSVGRGFRTAALQHTNLRLGQGYCGIAALERRIVYIPDLNDQETEFQRSPLFKDEGFVSYYGVPLLAKGQLAGVLEILHRESLSFSPEWEEFMETLASQAAIAIDNITMFKDLRTSHMELSLAYDATIEGWARALELRDMETEGHSRRVVDLTIKIAREMGIFDQELVHVRRGALLHDIGKMGVPDNILQKKSSLSDDEWVIMRQHPVHAFEMLSPIAYLRSALDIPYCHHEKWDGSGYPRGLKGEQIPLPARIFAIVDVWDALRSDRPYRDAWPEDKMIDYLREQSGQYFDPRVVDVFLRMIAGEVIEK